MEQAVMRSQNTLDEYLQFEMNEDGNNLTEEKVKLALQLTGGHLAQLFEHTQVVTNYKKIEGA